MLKGLDLKECIFLLPGCYTLQNHCFLCKLTVCNRGNAKSIDDNTCIVAHEIFCFMRCKKKY